MAKAKKPAAKKRINSRAKGCVGEREFAHLLAEHKLEARRGQQHAGGVDSPDVVCADLTNIHFEVKRVEAGNLYKWLDQAVRDAKHKKPIVAHRKNGKPWVAIVPMDFMLELLVLREGSLI